MKELTLETGNNISAPVNVTDHSYHKLSRSDCDLSIYFGTSQLAYTIFDNIHHRVVVLMSFDLDVPQDQTVFLDILKSQDINQSGFGKVKIAVDLEQSSLIPDDLFDPMEIETYHNFITSTDNPGQIFNDHVDLISAQNIYSIDPNLIEATQELFGYPQFYHISTPLINNTLKENKSKHENAIYVFYLGDHVILLGLVKGLMVFYNRFQIRAKEDFAYFILAVCEELHFNPEIVEVKIHGILELESPYMVTGKRFLKNITFGTKPKALKYSRQFSAYPDHLFAHIFSVNLCE